MISVKNVSKYYAGKAVLKNINLQLSFGETHVFLGSSGSGKSTLLRLITGLIKPDEGQIELTNLDTSNSKHLASNIAYVIQEGGLFPHLTASENVILAAKLAGWKTERIKSRVTELCKLVQLSENLLSQYPKQLSGGQRQRIALMRALMLDPPLIMLDEPLGALDPLVRSELQRELKQIFNYLKKTVILVTHDIGEGAFFGHTVSLFNEGKLIQHGNFKSFIKNPASDFVTRFIKAQVPPTELLESL
jgi:osmoprotectant transport system ATP-binding protein